MECRVHKLLADVVVLADDAVLLVTYRGMPDHQRGWFLPDDLLLHLEHPDDAAARVLKEQLGIEEGKPELAFIESFKGHDGSWHLVFHYRLRLSHRPDIMPSEDVEAARWFGLSDLPPRSEVAHHGWALDVLEECLASQGPSVA